MKSLLSYYYGMNVEKIIKKNNNYYFTYKLDHYIFSKIEIDKYKYDNLYRMNMELLKYNSLFHKIMINNYNSIITPVDKGNYILFKVNLRKNRKISIIDILQISKPIFLPKNIIANMDYSNWTDLWKKKINYLEYYVENKVGKNYLLTELLNYFIGIGENAITYIKDTTEQNNRFINNVVIEHDRINKNDTLWDLYNPLNIVFDNRVRDISEYFKDNMIKTICSDDWIKKNIAMCKFNNTEIRLFFGRILFPNFFFDRYEFFVNKKIKERDLLEFINQIEIYEININKLYKIINNWYKIPEIKWIEKSIEY